MEKIMLQRSRILRKEMTLAEKKLWSKLRYRQLAGLRFRRQVVLDHYIVDFACLEPKVIIELDGSQHMSQKAYDEKRTLQLQKLGYIVLRFWNNEVLNEINIVLESIYQICIPPSVASRQLPPNGGSRS